MMTVDRIDLERLRFALAHEIDLNCLGLAQPPELVLMQSVRRLVVELKAAVAGQRLGKMQRHEFVASWPASWWQALKDALFGWLSAKRGLRRIGRWLRNTFPVRLTEDRRLVEFDVSVIYPKIALPDHEHHIHVSKLVRRP